MPGENLRNGPDMKSKRVVITGMGVVSPNGIGLSAFLQALKKGRSGIRFFPLAQFALGPRFRGDDRRRHASIGTCTDQAMSVIGGQNGQPSCGASVGC